MKKYVFTEGVTKYKIKQTRKKLNLTQKEFAELVGVSVKTIQKWEVSNGKITGPIIPLIKLIDCHPTIINEFEIPPKTTKLRLWYMNDSEICTIIDVDEKNFFIKIYNYTNDRMSRAFGNNEHPSFTDYQYFLESRCFPKTRDKIKLELKEYELPFFDPMMIIEKTEGRIEEDNFWIKVER